MESFQKHLIRGSREVVPLEGVKALRGQLLVDPLYDPDVIGQYSSLIIPEEGQNPQSQQGIVVASGSDTHWSYPQLVLYMPYSAKPFTHEDHEYLMLKDHQIIGHVEDQKLIPRPGNCVVEPLWSSKVRQSPIIPIHEGLFSDERSPQLAKVIHGAGSVMNGDVVIIPEREGYELGFHDRVIYCLPVASILAVVENLNADS